MGESVEVFEFEHWEVGCAFGWDGFATGLLASQDHVLEPPRLELNRVVAWVSGEN